MHVINYFNHALINISIWKVYLCCLLPSANISYTRCNHCWTCYQTMSTENF